MNIISAMRNWIAPKAVITTSKELADVLGANGSSSFSGIIVTPDVAMMVAAVGAAVSLLSETVAQIPLPLYRRRADGGKDKATNNPLWSLLHDRPNSWQNSFEFREMMTLHMLLWGNAYAFMSRTKTGRSRGMVTELLPIHPDRVKVEQDKEYVVTYTISLTTGETIKVAAADILHIRDRSLDGVKGVSRLKYAQDTIGLARVTERWGAQLFGNGARPSGVLSTDGMLNDEQVKRLGESWKAAHGGENALGTAVLDGGLKWTPLAMTSTDSQYLENRKFQIAEISRIYRIPPHMLGDLEKATFSNIEHQSLEFVKFSLMPWIKRWEGALNTQLLDPTGEFFAEFVVDGLLRGDIKSRYEAYQIGVMNKWLSPNEIREKENMNPRDGGDVYENPAITPGEGVANVPAQIA